MNIKLNSIEADILEIADSSVLSRQVSTVLLYS